VDVPDRIGLKFRVNSNLALSMRDLDADQFREGKAEGGSKEDSKKSGKVPPAKDSKATTKSRRR
jgi:hypothetical protein